MNDNLEIAKNIIELNYQALRAESKRRGLNAGGKRADILNRILSSMGLTVDQVRNYRDQLTNDVEVLRDAPVPSSSEVSRVSDQARVAGVEEKLENILKLFAGRLQSVEQKLSAQEEFTAELLSEDNLKVPFGLSNEIMKFWPDRRAKEWELQQEYDSFMKLGRLASTIRIAGGSNQTVLQASKAMEEMIGAQAMKVWLIDQGEKEAAQYIDQGLEGTFADRFSSKLKEIRRFTGFKRKGFAALDLQSNGAKSSAVSLQDSSIKRSRLTCWNCGKPGHRRESCMSPQSKQGNESKTSPLHQKT